MAVHLRHMKLGRYAFLMAVMLTLTANADLYDLQFEEAYTLSCLDVAWVRIAASTRLHDSIPAVELRLVDPNGRMAGARVSSNESIPRSHYGNIIEMPKHPEISKAVAVEVCDPRQGEYEVTVWERTTGAKYDLRIVGDSRTSMESQSLTLASVSGRTCRFRFRLTRREGLEIGWIDKLGRTVGPAEAATCETVRQS